MSLSADGPGAAAPVPVTPPAAVPVGVPGLRGSRDDASVGLRVVLALLVLGALAGLVWVWLAPRVDFRVTSTDGGVEVVGGGLVSPELFMSDDGVYVLVLAGLGLLAGLVGWFVLRARRGVVLLSCLAGGMLLASLAAWQVGALLGRGPTADQLATVGTVVTTAVDLNALAALAVGPFTAVVVYLVATVLTSRDDLGRADPADPAAPSYPGASSSSGGHVTGDQPWTSGPPTAPGPITPPGTTQPR